MKIILLYQINRSKKNSETSTSLTLGFTLYQKKMWGMVQDFGYTVDGSYHEKFFILYTGQLHLWINV